MAMSYYPIYGGSENLSRVTGIPWVKEQTFANAAALYPDLIKDHPDYSRTGKVDPKDVFQILVVQGKSGFVVLLVHGVPRPRHTLARTKPSQHGAEKALTRLMDTTAELLGARYPAELGMPLRKERKTDNGAGNRDFL